MNVLAHEELIIYRHSLSGEPASRMGWMEAVRGD